MELDGVAFDAAIEAAQAANAAGMDDQAQLAEAIKAYLESINAAE